MTTDVEAKYSGKFEPSSAVGDIVAEGDTLARISVFGFRLKVKAPADGSISEICVLPDALVSRGDLLFRLETGAVGGAPPVIAAGTGGVGTGPTG